MTRPRRAPGWGRTLALCALAAVGIIAAAGPARAQSRWSAAGAFEGGYVHGGEFRSGLPKLMVLAGLDVRVGRFAGSDVRVGLSAEQPFGEMGVTAVCIPGSHGQCLQSPPDVRAIAATVGLRRSLRSRLAVGVTGGIGEVADARWGSPQRAFTGQFDLALRVAGSVWLTGGGRVVSWHQAGANLHAYTQVYGLRLN